MSKQVAQFVQNYSSWLWNDLVISAGTLGREQSAVALLRTDNTVGKREGELGGKELLDVRTTNIGVRDLGNTDDLDRSEASTVTGSHVLVAGNDSFAAGHLTVLLVHVVSARARVVTEPDAVVLDLLRTLLVDLYKRLVIIIIEHNRAKTGIDHTWLTETISPAAFLTLRSFLRKYQKRDLATTSLGAKSLILKSLGTGSCSEGSLRPTT
jgi:hypothetical protein